MVRSAVKPLIEPLDKLPMLDWRLISKRYFQLQPLIIDNKFHLTRIAHLMTSRGCLYQCVFCSTSVFWQKVRFFSVQRIADEIDNLYRNYQVMIFQIWDDLFAVSKERVRQIIEALKIKGLLGKVRFNIQGRTNLIDDEMCFKG